MPAPVSALYYPYIHIQSEDWLKSALLYWDHLDRIVPSDGFQTSDALFVRNLPPDFLRRVTPAGHNEAAFNRFMPQLEKLLAARGGNLWGTAQNTAGRARSAEQIEYVHENKMDQRLIELLMRSNLGSYFNGYVKLNPVLSGLYMTSLAGEIAQARYTPMVTDNSVVDVASLYLNWDARDPQAGRPAGGQRDGIDEMALARILVPFPSPADLSGTPLEDVLRVRETLAGERGRFREAIHQFGVELSTVPAAGRADIVSSKRKEIEESVARQRDALSSANISSVTGLVGLSVPAIAAAAPYLGISTSIAAAACVGISFVSWYLKTRSSLAAQRAVFPWQYLISTENALYLEAAGVDRALEQLVYD